MVFYSGTLPYQSRRAQMERFLSGETKVLVATDVIGMGLNLPIKRVIFTSDSKYDGTSFRSLLPGEVKQIAGRAGRFGIYDEGFVHRASIDLSIEKNLKATTPNISKAYLGFSDVLLDLDYDIVDVLKVWWQIPTSKVFKKTNISRYLDIIQRIRQKKISLTKRELLKAAIIPFSEDNDSLMRLFIHYLQLYVTKKEIPFPTLEQNGVDELELSYKKLDLYYSFCKSFGLAFDKTLLGQSKILISDKINENLVNLKSTHRKKCSRCGCSLPALYQYGICQDCYYDRNDDYYW